VHVEAGAVESVLPGYAREARADAVVMGAISRAYPDRALFGYTAENSRLRCIDRQAEGLSLAGESAVASD